MFYLRVKNPIPTNITPTQVAIRCSNCLTVYFFIRKLGQSLGSDCPDACPNCKKLLPTIDYLVSESDFMEPTGIRARLHIGDLI